MGIQRPVLFFVPRTLVDARRRTRALLEELAGRLTEAPKVRSAL